MPDPHKIGYTVKAHQGQTQVSFYENYGKEVL